MGMKTILLLLLGLRFGFTRDFDGILGCRTTKLDLVFLIDGSGQQFNRNYPLVRQWIQNITTNFDVSPQTTRVAVVQKGSKPYEEFSFRDFLSTEEVLDVVNNIQYGTGSASTAEGLSYTRNYVLAKARPDASVVVLILSDGTIRDPDEGYIEARQLHEIGVTTLAVGAGESFSNETKLDYLKALASHSVYDHTFVVGSLSHLGTLERSVIWEVCKHTVQECPTAAHDLAFVIDSSSTIGHHNFQRVKSGMKKIVEAFDVGLNETRIAVIQYSTFVREEIRFNDGYSKSEVLDKIDQMTLIAGDTHTGHALEYCMRKVYSDGHGSRNGVPDVVIVMTDGKAQDHHHVVNAARLLHEADIEVYAMGIGDSYSMEEIRDIASDPDEYHILHANTFRQIDFQRTGLIKRICEESEPGCPNTVADITFLVDNKVVMDEESLSNVKTWIKGVVDYLEVGEHYSRISLVRFGALPEKIFNLQDYESTSSVISVITRLPHQAITNEREHSAVGVAIDYVKSSIFGHAERNVPRFLVIVTNGESRDDFRPAVERAENAGIKLFSFGIGEVNLGNLQALATSPRYMFYEHSVLDVRRRIGSFMSELCRISEPACAIQEIDLQFLVDGSDNIRLEDFEKVKRWIRNVIRSFDIGNYTTRVGLIKYGDRVQKVFGMDTYQTKREIEYAVSVMTPMTGKPRTGLALYHALNHGFAKEGGSRPGTAKVLVVLSDGNSSDSTNKIIHEVHQAGIRVFAVGVARFTDRRFLEKIATEPVLTHVTESSSYDAINIVRQQIVNEICRETKAECPKAEMDLIFLVDGSATVGQERFAIMKRWLVSFVSQFEIGEYNSKFGLVQISNSPTLEINLKEVSDRESLMRAIHNMQHLSGEANIGKALEYVRRQGFSDEDNRRNIPKVIITLTSGQSRDSWHTPTWRLKNEGVIMYAVGVGDVRQSDLQSLASSRDNVLHVRNVDSISIIQSSLLRRICQGIHIGCIENATDIVMLVDGSYSIGRKGWELWKSFVGNITDRFEIGPHAVQLSIVQFASEPRIEFLLGEYDTWYSLKRAIRRIRWMTGDTHTARALRFARQHVLTPEAGARPNVAKLLFIVTDGSPQDRHEVNAAAIAVKEYGWKIFAIGFDEASLEELSMMASKPKSDHVFYADDFDSTRLLEGRLFRMICHSLVKIPDVVQVTRRRDELQDPDLDVISRVNSVAFSKPTTSTRQHVTSIEPDFDIGSVVKSTTKDASIDVVPGPISVPKITEETLPLTVRPSPWHNSEKTETVDPASAPGLYKSPSCPILRTSTGDYFYGWNFLIEIGVVRSGTVLRRSNGVIGTFENMPTAQPYSITPGTSGNIKAYQISAGEGTKQPLNAEFSKVFDSTWSFSVILRTHFAVNRTTWSLINLSDSAGKSVFSIHIDDMEKTISVDIMSGSIIKSVLATGDRIFPLFDRRYHKLEVIAGVSHVTLRLDCEIIARSAIKPPTAVSPDLLGSLVTSPSSGVTVDIQDMLFKCGDDDEDCCGLGGKCGEPGAITSDVNECECPPGPQGPPGRSIPGKPGPRGPPGKRAVLKKATIRAVAKKIALTAIKGEFRRMFKSLLSSISPHGTIDRKTLKTALSSLVAKGNRNETKV